MTVEEALEYRGLKVPGKRKCRCPNPDHIDNSPSALINPNSVWCFSCTRMYGIAQLEKWLGVKIDKVEESDNRRKSGEPLFIE